MLDHAALNMQLELKALSLFLFIKLVSTASDLLLFTLCPPSSFFIITLAILKLHFTSEEWLDFWLRVTFLHPSICYIPTKRSGDWAMFQQRNEPRPTSLPCAIIYSIKFVVSSQVMVMNMQGVNFFVSQSQTKETPGVDNACQLIGSLVALGQTGGG